MFLMFINDLPLVSKNAVTSTDLYADDTTVYNMQNALLLLNKWCRENGMVINTDKSKVMLITSRQKRSNLKDNNLVLYFNDVDKKNCQVMRRFKVFK